MKPQCTTAAQCLKELARVMEQFGFQSPLTAVNSIYVKFNCASAKRSEMTVFGMPDEWQFAIAEVEGKPVFIGDVLYYFDRKIIAGAVINGVIANAAGGMNYSPSALSWNPPKPATVMVELPYDYVVLRTEKPDTTILREACKTALEKLKS